MWLTWVAVAPIKVVVMVEVVLKEHILAGGEVIQGFLFQGCSQPMASLLRRPCSGNRS